MALVFITLQDMPDGQLNVSLNSEPPVLPTQTQFSPAQDLGAAALNAIHAQLQKVIDDSPRIVLAGADELPH